jgi:hypothetical protein
MELGGDAFNVRWAGLLASETVLTEGHLAILQTWA